MSEQLVAFLRARLDEDAALALAASPGPWHTNAEADEVLAEDGITVADGFALSGRQLRATTEHIARHDPARVLAEVAAKRRFLDDVLPDLLHADRLIEGEYNDDVSGQTLRLLALPHADHPDYDERWKP